MGVCTCVIEPSEANEQCQVKLKFKVGPILCLHFGETFQILPSFRFLLSAGLRASDRHMSITLIYKH